MSRNAKPPAGSKARWRNARANSATSNASLQTEIDEHRRTESRLRTTQNELVQAGKLAALGQMSAAIAHEINQPLAAIRTFMASAKIFAQRGNVAQMLSNLDLITDLAERMASITGHLKTFARKSEPGHPEPVLVDRAVEGTLFLLESQIKAAGVRIEKKVAPELWVLGHAVQLEQVILNLVRNALDAVADQVDGWIQITRARIRRYGVHRRIADNGPGISHDQISQIFDPFFTTKSVGKGLGLGLSISYGIVQDFGGEIQARNRAEGGAEMTVELPRHRRDTRCGRESGPCLKACPILFVDDEAPMRQAVTQWLGLAGFETLVHDKALAALDVLTRRFSRRPRHRPEDGRHRRDGAAAAVAADRPGNAGGRHHRTWRRRDRGRGDAAWRL